MSYFRTAILLAGLTGLFMGVGYLIGGASGATIALVVAAGMNLFAYWNSDRMVLSMHGAQEVDARSAPDLVNLVGATRAQRRTADAARLRHARGPAERVRHRPQSAERRRRRHHRPDEPAEPRGARRRDRARARAHQASRHADDDHHRHHRRCDLDGRPVRHVLRRQPRQQQRSRHHRLDRDDDPCAAGRDAGADGDQPHPRICRRRHGRAHLRPADVACLGAGKIENAAHQIPNPQAERNPATAHMFIINPLSGQGMDNLFATHPSTENRIAALRQLAGRVRRRQRLCDDAPAEPRRAARGTAAAAAVRGAESEHLRSTLPAIPKT